MSCYDHQRGPERIDAPSWIMIWILNGPAPVTHLSPSGHGQQRVACFEAAFGWLYKRIAASSHPGSAIGERVQEREQNRTPYTGEG